MVEVYSDSLNTKSEEKKYHSNSNEDDHRSSPSFYKISQSDQTVDGDMKDEKRSYRNSYIPASSFASGA